MKLSNLFEVARIERQLKRVNDMIDQIRDNEGGQIFLALIRHDEDISKEINTGSDLEFFCSKYMDHTLNDIMVKDQIIDIVVSTLALELVELRNLLTALGVEIDEEPGEE